MEQNNLDSNTSEDVKLDTFNEEEERLIGERYQSSWSPSWLYMNPRWKYGLRVILCGIAIGLIWLTSLAVATSIASLYITKPSYAATVNSWISVVELANEERLSAGSCVDREVAQCYWDLNTAEGQLFDVYLANAARNNATVTAEENRTSVCSNRIQSSLTALGLYLQREVRPQPLDVWNDYSVCPNETRQLLYNEMGYSAQDKSQVYRDNANFANDVNQQMTQVSQSVDARVDYDRNYWFGPLTGKMPRLDVKVKQIMVDPNITFQNINVSFNPLYTDLNTLTACMTLSDNSTCTIPSLNARTIYLQMQDNFNGLADEYARLANDLAGRYQIVLTDAQDYINSAEGVFAILRDVHDLFTVTGISLNQIPDDPHLSIPDPTLPGAPQVPNFGGLFAPLAQLKLNYLAKMNLTLRNLNANFSQYWSSMNVSLSGINVTLFSGYNPPDIYVPTLETQALSSDFLNKSKASLQKLDFNVDTKINASSYSNISFHYDDNFSILSDYHFFATNYYWGMSIENWLDAMSYFMYLIITADVVFRVFQSFVTVWKYWSMSDMGLPTIDVRSFDSKKVGWKWNFFTMMKWMPFVSVAIVGCFFIAAIVTMTAVYIPQYQSYQNACVHKSQNGTMVTRNGYSFAYNFAAFEYNEKVGRQMGQYDQRRTKSCTDYGAISQENQRNASLMISNSRTEYNGTAYRLGLFNQCVNGSKPDFPTVNDFARQNITIIAHPFTDPVEAAMRVDCGIMYKYATPGLEDAVFNCTLLPPCSLACTGPDRQALFQATYDSGCQSEWMVHAGLFRLALAFLVYICLNISRVLIMTALVRLCWRTLSSKGFEFIASCNRMGRFSSVTQDKLKEATDTAMKKFEAVAWVYLVIAVLVHIPYIVILSSVGHSINAATSQT